VLVDWHFDEPGAPAWRGTAVDRRQFQSRTPWDIRLSQNKEGIHYLQISCGGRQCDPGQVLFQDVPIDRVKDGERIDYGFSGVVEGNEGGPMHVELSERDRAGREVWSTSFDADVPTGARAVTPDESVYRASSVFLTSSPPVRIAPGAAWLRLSLYPRSTALYDVLDAEVMPRTAPSP